MKFADIPGLKDIKSTLIRAVKNNHVAHAQLFLGPKGSGNLAMALAYGAYLNCDNPQEEDICGECPSCSKFGKLVYPDLHFLFPVAGKIEENDRPKLMANWRAYLNELPYGSIQEWSAFNNIENKQPNISVDEVRKIIGTLAMKSFEGKYKIAILWLPEYMKAEPANALLKVLEEPTEKTIFLLVSNDIEKLMTTIISRTQLVKIPPFTDEEISTYLIDNCGISNEKALEIAPIADGDLQEAFRLMNDVQDINLPFFQQWFRNCFTKKFDDLTAQAEDFEKLGRESQKNLIQFGLAVVRESLMYNFGSQDAVRLPGAQKDFVKNFSKVVNENNIENITKHLTDAYYYVERNANAKLLFMDTSIKLASVLK